jgi:hypothetical protein
MSSGNFNKSQNCFGGSQQGFPFPAVALSVHYIILSAICQLQLEEIGHLFARNSYCPKSFGGNGLRCRGQPRFF